MNGSVLINVNDVTVLTVQVIPKHSDGFKLSVLITFLCVKEK